MWKYFFLNKCLRLLLKWSININYVVLQEYNYLDKSYLKNVICENVLIKSKEKMTRYPLYLFYFFTFFIFILSFNKNYVLVLYALKIALYYSCPLFGIHKWLTLSIYVILYNERFLCSTNVDFYYYDLFYCSKIIRILFLEKVK